MKNRIAHLFSDSSPRGESQTPAPGPEGEPGSGYPLPRGINMLMPAEICIHRELLTTLLTASIDEMQRHTMSPPGLIPDRARNELEAALQQQLAFRAWVRGHPSSYISIALYPTSETDPVEGLEGLEDFGDF